MFIVLYVKPVDSFSGTNLSFFFFFFLGGGGGGGVNIYYRLSPFSVIICNYEYAHQGSKFFLKQFRMRSIVHISIFVVNINLIIMFNPKIYIYFHGSFSLT